MNKTIKLISTLVMVLLVVTTLSNTILAVDAAIDSVKPNLVEAQSKATQITELGSTITSILQYVAIIGGVVILSILGIKYMMGSVEEKAEYKKSFIPLIVGVIVVMGATVIAKFLFNTFTLKG